MKKYTLEQLKTEKIAINVRTKKEASSLLQKFDEIGLNCCKADVDYMFGSHKNQLCFNIDKFEPPLIGWCSAIFYHDNAYTIITPDQIDWGEEKKAEVAQVTINGGIMPPTDWKITTATPKQDNPPAVITKAVKDWNAFKSFIKEIEMHGRGLTSSQLKTFMAKTRRDMEDK